LPPAAQTVISKALAKAREVRYQTVAALAGDLQTLPRPASGTERAAPQTAVERAQDRRPRSELAVAATQLDQPLAPPVPLPAAQPMPPGTGRPQWLVAGGPALLDVTILAVVGVVLGAQLVLGARVAGGLPATTWTATTTEHLLPTATRTTNGLAAQQTASQRTQAASLVSLVTPTPTPTASPSATPRTPSPTPSHTATLTPLHTILFVSDRDGNSELYVMRADGSSQTRLTHSPEREFDPAWSPDGARITFISEQSGNYELYTMNADGANQARLTNMPGAKVDPVWSPDGTRIAFGVRANRDALYVANADGSALTRLSAYSASFGGAASWSPDGTRIAFKHSNADVGIQLMTADGTPLASNGPGVGTSQPAWSPDGIRIVFMRSPGLIYVMNADGSNLSLLKDTPCFDNTGNPVWSLDGSRLVFACALLNSNDQIYRMNADGSNLTRLTNLPDRATEPAWSPDSTRIAFTASGGIYVMDANGSNLRRLADGNHPVWRP
jgi:Tol biopolymer transport system component